MSLYDNLDVSSARFTSTPPIGAEATLIATLPANVTGAHLKALRKASAMSPSKFAALIGVSPEWLRLFENGKPPLLSRCRPSLQLGVARAMTLLGVKLTKDGWELIEGGGG
jgi:DNA-binding XRE family transcriptional regulator